MIPDQKPIDYLAVAQGITDDWDYPVTNDTIMIVAALSKVLCATIDIAQSLRVIAGELRALNNIQRGVPDEPPTNS